MMALRISDIKDEVRREFQLERHDIDSDRKGHDVSIPRQLAYKLARLHTTYSFPRIARDFGGRDHTTIITGIRSIDKRLAKEPELQDRFDSISARLDQLATPNSEETIDGRDQVPGHGQAAQEEGPPDRRADDTGEG